MDMPQTDEVLAKLLKRIDEVTSGQGVDLAGRILQMEAKSNLLYPLGALAVTIVLAFSAYVADGYIPIETSRYAAVSGPWIFMVFLTIGAAVAGLVTLIGSICTYLDMAVWLAARDPKSALTLHLLRALTKS